MPITGCCVNVASRCVLCKEHYETEGGEKSYPLRLFCGGCGVFWAATESPRGQREPSACLRPSGVHQLPPVTWPCGTGIITWGAIQEVRLLPVGSRLCCNYPHPHQQGVQVARCRN